VKTAYSAPVPSIVCDFPIVGLAGISLPRTKAQNVYPGNDGNVEPSRTFSLIRIMRTAIDRGLTFVDNS